MSSTGNSLDTFGLENNFKYDVFISYARLESDWVRTYLYEPLRKRRTKDNRPVRIFFDKGEGKETISPGDLWQRELAKAISESRKFIPVYSLTYFDERRVICDFELQQALRIDPAGHQKRICPISKDSSDVIGPKIPLEFQNLHFLQTSKKDWFETLCNILQLRPLPNKRSVLAFLNQPIDIPANNTMSHIRVQIQGNNSAMENEEEIHMSAGIVELVGTLSQRTTDGIATFNDLLIATPETSIRLKAFADGFETVESESFNVLRPIDVPNIEDDQGTKVTKSIDKKGEVVFFSNEEALVVIASDDLSVYDVEGNKRGRSISIQRRLKQFYRGDDILIFADWFGCLYMIGADGSYTEFKAPGPDNVCRIPGGVTLIEDTVYVAYWSGILYRLSRGTSPDAILEEETGIQAFEILGESIYIVTMEGVFKIFERGDQIAAYPLEQSGEVTGTEHATIHYLKAFSNRVVAVGDHNLYCIMQGDRKLLIEPLPFTGVKSVLGDIKQPIVVSPSGKGVRFNEVLTYCSYFHTMAGAVPISADDSGRYSIFLNPDGTWSLMVDDKIRYTHAQGTLAISRGGRWCSVGEPGRTRLLNAENFEVLIKGNTGASNNDRSR